MPNATRPHAHARHAHLIAEAKVRAHDLRRAAVNEWMDTFVRGLRGFVARAVTALDAPRGPA